MTHDQVNLALKINSMSKSGLVTDEIIIIKNSVKIKQL